MKNPFAAMRSPKDIDWSTVDVWDDVWHLDPCGLFFIGWLPFLSEANAVETIRYLRRSSHFRPSETWKPLLDDAFAKVAARSVSWSD